MNEKGEAMLIHKGCLGSCQINREPKWVTEPARGHVAQARAMQMERQVQRP